MIQLYGKENFTFEIRKIFNNANDARIWESRVLKRLNVRTNESWVNKTDNTSIPPMYGKDNPSSRQMTKDKISRANKGRKRPDQSKRLLEKHHMKDEVSRLKMSQTKKMKYATGELVQKTKGQKRPEMTGPNHPLYGIPNKKLSSMNTIESTCPHCGKVGKGPGMQRYHFSKCNIIGGR